ncbi:hypothetical protein D3C73_1361040 [compost metagenome]
MQSKEVWTFHKPVEIVQLRIQDSPVRNLQVQLLFQSQFVLGQVLICHFNSLQLKYNVKVEIAALERYFKFRLILNPVIIIPPYRT